MTSRGGTFFGCGARWKKLIADKVAKLGVVLRL